MPPKRKRDADSNVANASSTTRVTRRSTRSSKKSVDAPEVDAATSSNATTSKTKTKRVNASGNSAEEEDEEEAPPLKKARTSTRGKAAAKASKGKGKKNSHDDNPETVNEDNENKNAPSKVNGAKTSAMTKAVTNAEPYTPERALSLFGKYADEADPDIIGPGGLELLCKDADISMEGVLPLLLSWQLNAKELGTFTQGEWVAGTANLKISSLQILRLALSDLEDLLVMDKPPLKPLKNESYNRTSYWTYAKDKRHAFHQFYSFCFNLAKAEQSRNIDMEVVTALWSVILPPRFPIMTEIITFINGKGTYKAANKDLWIMMLEFCESVKPTLEGYDQSGDAWPTLLDEFVEWKRSQGTASSS
ncbi:hypothetical protein E1B28_002460 [Marasmius oreades]|uniref:Defective in cullin neddylation protein n=1 Tax=Marasmius oreades TaxID=181124 RepID=A0A9P7UKQ0_9AGAR|nr:uncharacterized protein E1B28_002460 [Marasmius oreades]KAG7086507.1 hypothetical protein E1B28_002460 [Marasmius oreades]